MPMTEDFTAFFNIAEHGTTATYNAADVVGIFEDQFVEVSGIESIKPTFTCAAADVSGVAHGDSITIDAVIYNVQGLQPDGTGTIMLILRAP